jgi:hypothetical protein
VDIGGNVLVQEQQTRLQMQSTQPNELAKQGSAREIHVSVCAALTIIELNAGDRTLVAAGQAAVLMLAIVSACVAAVALALFN